MLTNFFFTSIKLINFLFLYTCLKVLHFEFIFIMVCTNTIIYSKYEILIYISATTFNRLSSLQIFFLLVINFSTYFYMPVKNNQLWRKLLHDSMIVKEGFSMFWAFSYYLYLVLEFKLLVLFFFMHSVSVHLSKIWQLFCIFSMILK